MALGSRFRRKNPFRPQNSGTAKSSAISIRKIALPDWRWAHAQDRITLNTQIHTKMYKFIVTRGQAAKTVLTLLLGSDDRCWREHSINTLQQLRIIIRF